MGILYIFLEKDADVLQGLAITLASFSKSGRNFPFPPRPLPSQKSFYAFNEGPAP